MTWSRIREWSRNYVEAKPEPTFLKRIEQSLEYGTLVISTLQQDLAAYTNSPDTMNFRKRSRVIWNEKALRDHQYRVRGQAIAMSLLLQVLDLPTPIQRIELLRTNEHELRKTDESAYSIIPSRLSSRISLSTYDSFKTTECADLLHHRLSCENDLFAVRVYKRNYKKFFIRSLFRSKDHMTSIEKCEVLVDKTHPYGEESNDIEQKFILSENSASAQMQMKAPDDTLNIAPPTYLS